MFAVWLFLSFLFKIFMLKLQIREKMKNISRFLLLALTLCGVNAYASAPVATTAGSNLTAFNGGSGATNNAMWNSYMNPRANSVNSVPEADFGNCNALILRCAQPKCVTGGCTSMEVTKPIVSGCVEINESCKQYGESLIETIAAQIVANTNAKATQAAADAQTAAAQAVAEQSAEQMAQMQQQMLQMQQQMQQQSADTAAQIQAALAQQQEATNQAIANVAAASSTANVPAQTPSVNSTESTVVSGTAAGVDLTTAQQVAAASGVSADLLAREQISGQILTKIENAEVALKSARAAMENAFTYAGCNSTGSNCTGPKRVSMFKTKAMEFFDPYNEVLDEVYDALILAQSVGVDITDIYMMLNGTCNVWGLYLCSEGQVMHYNKDNCPNGKSVPVATADGIVLGNADCKIGQVVPMSDGGCQLIKMLTDEKEVQRNWLYPEDGEDGVQVRVGCASEILDNSMLFRSRKKESDIDIEVLQRMIEQDAPSSYGSLWGTSKTTPMNDGVIYCAVTENTYNDLQKHAALKTLPDKVCVPQSKLSSYTEGVSVADSVENDISFIDLCENLTGAQYEQCLCKNGPDKNYTDWNSKESKCVCRGNTYTIFDIDQGRCVTNAENGSKSRADTARDEAQESLINKYKEPCEQAGGKLEEKSYLWCQCEEDGDREACDKVNENIREGK